MSPERRQQSAEALRRANECRCARARVKDRVEAGKLTALQVVQDLDEHRWCMGKTTIHEILAWQPRWGKVRANKFVRRSLSTVLYNPHVEVRNMSPRQVTGVLDALQRLEAGGGSIVREAVYSTRLDGRALAVA